MFHFKSWLMVTPSNLALVTNSRGLPFRTRGSKSWLLLENPVRSSLHLAHSVGTHRDSLVSKGHPELLGVCSHYPLRADRRFSQTLACTLCTLLVSSGTEMHNFHCKYVP